MNRNGEISNKPAPIVAIDFDTIFSRKPSAKEKIFGHPLKSRFVEEYKHLTLTLYNKGFNIYITSSKDISCYEDVLWGEYVFFNSLVTHTDLKDLAFNCKHVYKYYIDETNKVGLLDNVYSLKQFKELL